MEQKYPLTYRRLRTGAAIRELTATVKLSHKSFIQPLFVDETINRPQPLNGLGDVRSETLSSVLDTIENALKNECSKFLIFPVPAHKHENDFDFSFAGKIFATIKEQFGSDVWLASDVCLCSYTTHGHCGILNDAHTKLLNDATVQQLAAYAHILAQNGADCIAPSDMMDGRIAAIRKELDNAGFDNIAIMSYAAKFSSQFYGPFRDACSSAPQGQGLKDRKTYQMSPLNPGNALASALRDESEGADILMVKPAAFYTDVITALKQKTTLPVAAYHVSGEFAAVEALAEKGFCDRIAAHTEVWTALQRSGADIIISYAAQHAKKWLQDINY